MRINHSTNFILAMALFIANSVFAKNTNVGKENGLISELVYNERQPRAVAQLLLPLLQQLPAVCFRLTPQQSCKQWLQQSGLG